MDLPLSLILLQSLLVLKELRSPSTLVGVVGVVGVGVIVVGMVDGAT
jgi:hypothetical protein